MTQARLARGVRQVLVYWRGEPASSATWEDLDEFRATYPEFQLEDELDLEGGGRCHVGPRLRQAPAQPRRTPRRGTREPRGPGRSSEQWLDGKIGLLVC